MSDSVCVRMCFGSQHKEGVSCHPQGSGIVHAWGGPIILFFFHLNELLSCPPLISGVWQRVIEDQSPRKWSLFTQPKYAGPTAACLWFIGPKIPSSGNNNALKLQTPLPHRTSRQGSPSPGETGGTQQIYPSTQLGFQRNTRPHRVRLTKAESGGVWPPLCSTSSWEGAATGVTMAQNWAGPTASPTSQLAQRAHGGVYRGNLGPLADAWFWGWERVCSEVS